MVVNCCETRIWPSLSSYTFPLDLFSLTEVSSPQIAFPFFTGCRLPGIEAVSLDTAFWLIKRNHAQGCLCLLFDRQFGGAIFGPLHAHKTTLLRDDLFECMHTSRHSAYSAHGTPGHAGRALSALPLTRRAGASPMHQQRLLL